MGRAVAGREDFEIWEGEEMKQKRSCANCGMSHDDHTLAEQVGRGDMKTCCYRVGGRRCRTYRERPSRAQYPCGQDGCLMCRAARWRKAEKNHKEKQP